MTEEENVTQTPEQAPAPDLGKFQSVDALMRAYRELEAEFTRRSQRLRALEASAPHDADAEKGAAQGADSEALLRAVRGTEEVRSRIVGEYLAAWPGGPLMAGTGAGVTAPAARASTLKQAGAMALGYLKHQKHGG